jgi:hypothetical protein
MAVNCTAATGAAAQLHGFSATRAPVAATIVVYVSWQYNCGSTDSTGWHPVLLLLAVVCNCAWELRIEAPNSKEQDYWSYDHPQQRDCRFRLTATASQAEHSASIARAPHFSCRRPNSNNHSSAAPDRRVCSCMFMCPQRLNLAGRFGLSVQHRQPRSFAARMPTKHVVSTERSSH